MSPSSSGSWGAARRAGDIIDLDRYMRGHVRPSRSSSEEGLQCEQLVVDGGGIGRKPVSDVRYKHYSHDSGVSDGSYDQRRSYRPRRVSNSDGRFRAPRDQLSARTFNGQGHSDSLREFRTVCEQALLDQQKQIERVTQLCEQLTERADERITERNERCSEGLSGRENERTRTERREDKKTSEKISSDRAKRAEPVLSDTSDISSSSRSTKDLRRKEKHRTQECKTYKIIMSKLDELNRRFVSSRPAPPTASGSGSASDVSVCDKLVATDSHRVPPKIEFRSGGRGAPPAPTVYRARVVAQAYNVDIAPREVTCRPPNVVTEMVKCESSSGSKSSADDPRCHFDLEDPVHLYSQAKRLQALNASIRRARSHSSTESRTNAFEPSIRGTAARASIRSTAARASRARERSPSICSVCRGYWRSLRQCLVAPFAQDCKCS